MIIYHNPRCSKSRQTLALLEENGVDLKVVEYLKNPPRAEELKNIQRYLGAKSAQDMVRKKEDAYKQLQLHSATDKEIWQAIEEHPILLERPIVVNGTRAAIGRPPEAVLDLL